MITPASLFCYALSVVTITAACNARADAPTPPTVAEWLHTGDEMMRLIDKMTLPGSSDLAKIRDDVADVQKMSADLQAREDLSPDNQKLATAFEARVATWSVAKIKALAAEETGRENAVVPLCGAVDGLAEARAGLAHERANPSGVVNLVTLHDLGEYIQNLEPQIKPLTQAYVAFRHRAFRGSQTEVACDPAVLAKVQAEAAAKVEAEAVAASNAETAKRQAQEQAASEASTERMRAFAKAQRAQH
jgi:hypothetical protein